MWKLNGTKPIYHQGPQYTINVTDNITGIMTCTDINDKNDVYHWDITVLLPSKFIKYELCKYTGLVGIIHTKMLSVLMKYACMIYI